jgi:hypothetical protein
VVVLAIDQGDVDGEFGEIHRGVDTRETSSDYDDPLSCSAARGHCSLAPLLSYRHWYTTILMQKGH